MSEIGDFDDTAGFGSDPFDPFASPLGDHNGLDGADDWFTHPADPALTGWLEEASRAAAPGAEGEASGWLNLFSVPGADTLAPLHWPAWGEQSGDPASAADDGALLPGGEAASLAEADAAADIINPAPPAGFDVHLELDRLTGLAAPGLTDAAADGLDAPELPAAPAAPPDAGKEGAATAATAAERGGSGGAGVNDADGGGDDDLVATGGWGDHGLLEGAAAGAALPFLLPRGTEEQTRRVYVSQAAWNDVADAAVALGHRAEEGASPAGLRDARSVALSFLLRVQQAFALLARQPDAGVPLPPTPLTGLVKREPGPGAPHAAFDEVRVYALTEADGQGERHQGDLYYRLLPDPDGPDGPEMDGIHILRLLPAAALTA